MRRRVNQSNIDQSATSRQRSTIDCDPDVSSQEPSPSLAGFSLLQTRLQRWTGNLLATSLIIVVLIGLGRMMAASWKMAAPDRRESTHMASNLIQRETQGRGIGGSAQISNQFEWTSIGVAGQFVERMSFQGDSLDAIEELKDKCMRVAAESEFSQLSESSNEIVERLNQLVVAGQRRGASLKEEESGEQDDSSRQTENGYRVESFLVEGPLPFVVGVLQAEDVTKGPLGVTSRIACWGLAMPITSNADPSSAKQYGEGQQWTLFCLPANGRVATERQLFASERIEELQGFRLPNGTRSVVSIELPGEYCIERFTCPRRIETCVDFFQSHGWQTSESQQTEQGYLRTLVHDNKDDSGRWILHLDSPDGMSTKGWLVAE